MGAAARTERNAPMTTLTDNQARVLHLLAENRPLPGDTPAATLGSLNRRGMITTDPSGYRWITVAGRAAIGNPAPKRRNTRPCGCGCGVETGGRFAPGHDARVKGQVARRLADNHVKSNRRPDRNRLIEEAIKLLPSDSDVLAARTADVAMNLWERSHA